jgi:small subunit ribosomal protein S18
MADEINRRDDEDVEELDNEEEEEQDGVVGEAESSEDRAPRERQPERRRSPRPPQQEGFNRGGGRMSSGPPRRGGGRFQPRRRVCIFCADKNRTIDWKDIDGLQRFVTETGDIRPRRKTGTCAKHQRRLAEAIKRARIIALLPYTSEHVRISGSGRRY